MSSDDGKKFPSKRERDPEVEALFARAKACGVDAKDIGETAWKLPEAEVSKMRTGRRTMTNAQKKELSEIVRELEMRRGRGAPPAAGAAVGTKLRCRICHEKWVAADGTFPDLCPRAHDRSYIEVDHDGPPGDPNDRDVYVYEVSASNRWRARDFAALDATQIRALFPNGIGGQVDPGAFREQIPTPASDSRQATPDNPAKVGG